jgi:hypothetical protein
MRAGRGFRKAAGPAVLLVAGNVRTELPLCGIIKSDASFGTLTSGGRTARPDPQETSDYRNLSPQRRHLCNRNGSTLQTL